RLEWASWLDDSAALTLWSSVAARRPERPAELGAVFADRRLWDRFWALSARDRWSLPALLALLPEEARTAWFARWQSPSPTDPDPALRTRAEALARAGVALGRLVAGSPGAEPDPIVAELRGPMAIGQIVGSQPRFDPLWEESPGTAWYVLDALVRLREHDGAAALVPLEAKRGREAERTRLAAALAEAGGGDDP